MKKPLKTALALGLATLAGTVLGTFEGGRVFLRNHPYDPPVGREGSYYHLNRRTQAEREIPQYIGTGALAGLAGGAAYAVAGRNRKEN
jgi:hypothetical protein